MSKSKESRLDQAIRETENVERYDALQAKYAKRNRLVERFYELGRERYEIAKEIGKLNEELGPQPTGEAG